MVNLNSGDIPRSKSKTKSLLLQVSNEFCESTSLHGYSYIANGNSVALKIFWSTIIVCLTAIGIKFLIVNTQDYMESRLVTGIDSSSAPLNVSYFFLKLSLWEPGAAWCSLVQFGNVA